MHIHPWIDTCILFTVDITLYFLRWKAGKNKQVVCLRNKTAHTDADETIML